MTGPADVWTATARELNRTSHALLHELREQQAASRRLISEHDRLMSESRVAIKGARARLGPREEMTTSGR
jgi:hypothetical protein